MALWTRKTKKNETEEPMPPPPKQAAANSGTKSPMGYTVDASRVTDAYGSTLRNYDWQQQIRKYDVEGPGFVGFSLDTVAQIASMGTIIVTKRDPITKNWEPVQEEVPCRLANEWANQQMDTPDMVYRGVRLFESTGEFYQARKDNADFGHGIEYFIYDYPNLGQIIGSDTHDPKREIRTRRGAMPGEPGYQLISERNLDRAWYPDPHFPEEATSTMRRALPDIERYVDYVRNSRAMARSRMLNNGWYWISSEAAASYAKANSKNGKIQPDAIHRDIARMGKRVIDDEDNIAQHLMFGISTPEDHGKPEILQQGYRIDDRAFTGEDQALAAFARTVILPTKSIIQGIGDGNHWSDWLLVEEVIRSGVEPKTKVFMRELSRVYFRKALAAMKKKGKWSGNPDVYRLEIDYTDIIKQPDQSANMLHALYAGAIDHETYVTEGLGLPKEKAIELPPGITPYEYARQMYGAGGGGGSAAPQNKPRQQPNTRRPPTPSAQASLAIGLEEWDDDGFVLPEDEGVSQW